MRPPHTLHCPLTPATLSLAQCFGLRTRRPFRRYSTYHAPFAQAPGNCLVRRPQRLSGKGAWRKRLTFHSDCL